MLTGPEAGITRDAIGIDWEWHGQRIKLWDTAGMRKKARVNDKLEKMSVSDGLRAIKFAEVIVLLIDATQPLEKQDLQLASLMAREGRAMVLAINKWDLVDEKDKLRREIEIEVTRLLPQVSGIAVVTAPAISARAATRRTATPRPRTMRSVAASRRASLSSSSTSSTSRRAGNATCADR